MELMRFAPKPCIVAPAKGGQGGQANLRHLGSRFRGNDGIKFYNYLIL
jgi:hypothetical protein